MSLLQRPPLIAFVLAAACRTGHPVSASDLGSADLALPTRCSGAAPSHVAPGERPPAAPALTVAAGFTLQTVARVAGARELASLPNGDLLVGTSAEAVYLVPNAEADLPGAPVEFTRVADPPVEGVTFSPSTCTVYVSSQHGVYAIPYVDGETSAPIGSPIAKVRSGPIAPGSDGDVHTSSSVAVAGGALYIGVGSSCNACAETDSTRATIQKLDLTTMQLSTRATHIRNAIALAENPATGTLWAGGAGQDALPHGHPLEYFDAVTLHPAIADYGWPGCEEDRVAYGSGADCSKTVVPAIELPAYSTLIGAVFYPTTDIGAHAFPSAYRGGLFITAHGSWHKTGGSYDAPPRVVYVPMTGDTPKSPVDWNDPSKQWSEFIGGFQRVDGVTRIARPTGITVGAEGSLFFADDQNGLVYRVRPR